MRFLVLLMGLLFPQFAFAKTVCINQIVAHPALDRTVSGLIDYLKTEDKAVEFIQLNAQNNGGLNLQNAQKCYAEQASVNVGVATLSAQSFLAQIDRFKVPLVFTSVTDPKNAGLLENALITGVSNFIPQDQQLKFFKTFDAQVKTIGVIYNLSESNSKSLNDALTALAPQENMRVVTKGVVRSADIKSALDQLLTEADAIFVNNDNMMLAAMPLIGKTVLAQKKLLFVSDVDIVEQGAIAALGPDQYELGSQTGRMIAAILSGKAPADLPYETPRKIKVMINCKVANQLQKKISQTQFPYELTFVAGDQSCLSTNI